MAQSPSIFLTIAAFLLVLGPLVLVHELGHLLVARIFGIRADAFSIGFGKELTGWNDRHGTRWKLSAWPLGGYVQFAGDLNASSLPAAQDETLSPEERAGMFQFRPIWQRSLVVLAGPLTNLFVAIAIFAAFNLASGRIESSPVVAGFSEHSPAEAAGIRIGDRVVAVEGNTIGSFDDIRERVVPFAGYDLAILVERGGRQLPFTVHAADHVVKDKFGNESRIGLIGIAAGKIEIVPVGPVEAVTLASRQSWGIMRMMVTGIGQIFTGHRSVKELGGPIKIAKYSGERLSMGWPEFVWFVAMISINLAFINLLPIPALDGGHLAFYVAEWVRRKPLGLRSQECAFRTGVAFVLALMLFVTLNDLASLKLFGG